MAEKFSIYAGMPLAAALAGYDESRSARVNQVCADYIECIQHAMPELPRAEWCAIFDALNGLWIEPGEASTRRLLWAEIADCEGLGEKWGIDQTALYTRVRAMTVPELIAVCEATRAFWLHCQQPTDQALQLSGARIAP